MILRAPPGMFFVCCLGREKQQKLRTKKRRITSWFPMGLAGQASTLDMGKTSSNYQHILETWCVWRFVVPQKNTWCVFWELKLDTTILEVCFPFFEYLFGGCYRIEYRRRPRRAMGGLFPELSTVRDRCRGISICRHLSYWDTMVEVVEGEISRTCLQCGAPQL